MLNGICVKPSIVESTQERSTTGTARHTSSDLVPIDASIRSVGDVLMTVEPSGFVAILITATFPIRNGEPLSTALADVALTAMSAEMIYSATT